MKDLTSFIKKYCSNWSTTCRMCVGVDGTKLFNEGPCRVLKGKPCKYFEKSVFPICDPNYKFAILSLKYEDISYQYGTISGNIGAWSYKNSRLCKCGNPLKFHCQLCDECKKKNAKKSARKWKKTRG